MSKFIEDIARQVGNRANMPDYAKCEEIVRIVIAAIREPSRAMLDGTEWLYPMCDDPHESHEDVWRSMIDKALEEKL